MTTAGHDSLGTKKSLDVNGKTYKYFSLKEAEKHFGDISLA
jgi:aconitate hydratase